MKRIGEWAMEKNDVLPRRDFLRNAVMLAGVGVTASLWA